MKVSQHPLFGRVYILVMSIAELIIALSIFFALQHSTWAKGFIAYSCLIILVGLVLYHLALMIFAEDIDIQMWMDEHVFFEPIYLRQLIFHFVFFVSLLAITHLIFMFLRLFLEKAES